MTIGCWTIAKFKTFYIQVFSFTETVIKVKILKNYLKIILLTNIIIKHKLKSTLTNI